MNILTLLILVTLLAGAMMPLQAGINAQLARGAGGAIWAAFISFAVGALALGAYLLVLRQAPPSPQMLGQLPWWQWTGGLLGAFFVAVAAFVAPRLGAAAFIAILVAGQMLASLLLDHQGWVGYLQREVNGPRIAGALMVIAGVVLIRRN
ncbi:DMT family transporter [Gallaecimonas kandeliae]|uniref:DMT family transporter n=1 Tax=Gallaecimonas kandeliae TaxID=3029055 RepID=UPI002648FA0D|nr:DMT family transporter [Gallaecimonas kandeliae]WKE66858.1 DMT family transporter [Gallaecimonas kandeliae]